MNGKKITLWVSSVAVLVALFMAAMSTTMGIARVNKAKSLKIKLQRPDLIDLKFVAVNNWYYAMRNNGSYMYDSPDADGNGNNAGGEFPRGSGVTIVFAGGIYIGTIKGGEAVVSETEFATEFQPGRITNDGVSFAELTGENPLDASNVVYLNDRGLTGTWPTDGPRDQFGLPGIFADAQTWAVFNDLDVSLNQESDADSPNPGLGMQVVLQSFAFNAGPLSDVVYLKFEITNKTNVDYADSYLGLWMDPDVDDAGNDIVGVDTARGLGFCYNEDNTDAIAATGFDFFQGPQVSSADVSAPLAARFAGNTTKLAYDPITNVYKPRTLGGDSILLGATAFNTYANGTDPVDNQERYNLLAGRDKSSGIPKFGCGVNDYYAFRGDPLATSGLPNCDVAGIGSTGPNSGHADQRMLHCVGPFTIAAGATQEVWAGVVGATGTGDRLNAIANMRTTDDLAQTTFEAGLVAPAPPAAPKITVTPLDGAVSITWQNNSELTPDQAGAILGINTTNGYSDDYVAYDFQGYRVYKSITGLPGSYTQLATYDKADGLTTVINRFLNKFGHLEMVEVVVGTDTGLEYAYVDHNVINGQRYYYSVTAYDAQPYISNTAIQIDADLDGDGTDETLDAPSGLPISLESAATSNVVSVVPMTATLGNSYTASVTTPVHSAGGSDGSLEVEVIDPTKVTGHNYRLEFFNLTPADGYPGSDFAYRIVDVTANATANFSTRIDDPATTIDERTFNTSLNSEFGVVDGMLIKISGPPLEVKGFGYTGGNGTGARWMTGVNFGFEAFFGGLTIGPNFAGSTVGDADYRDIDLVFSNDPSGWQIAYGHTSFGGTQNETFTIPFSVWEVDATDGDGTPQQMNVAVRDAANLNGWFLDNTLGGDGTGPAVRCYVYPTNRPYDAGAGDPLIFGVGTASLPSLFAMDMAPRNAAALAWNDLVKTAAAGGLTAVERDTVYTYIPDDGTFHIFANHVNTTSDVFTFSTTANAVTTAKKDLKKGLDDIKVVPNPYYGREEAYQASLFDKRVKFTNLPAGCTIKIFTVAGDMIASISHNSASNNDRRNVSPLDLTGTPASASTSIEHWNLQNADGKFVASGMYIALVDAPGIGKKLVKFAVIQEEVTINGPDIR
jgi:hypothetical protein